MSTLTASRRVQSIDILRGIVMVIMALDHTRDYFSGFKYDPLDFQHTTTALFLTRWITNFCAPVFVFLSGTSVFLSMNRGKTRKQASWLLLTRGLWLILLEVTVIRFGWFFNVDYSMLFLQVIWAIGWSMIFLSVVIHLPRSFILGIGLIMIFGHNVLDNIKPEQFGHMAFLWDVLHVQGPIAFAPNEMAIIIYPLVPWLGVMATGYCFGALVQMPEAKRNRLFYAVGISAIVLFIIIRYLNVYGDPRTWEPQATLWFTVLGFINCAKYPPSLLYLLMTLGPAIASLPLLEKARGAFNQFFTVYGRVPMFYYILHIYLIHILTLITGLAMGFPANRFTTNNAIFTHDAWGFSLPIVYLWWLTVVFMLYFPCRWFMRYKQMHRSWWLSYL